MDTLDANLIEAARSELAACTRRTPEVVALASVASLARSVEPELLRALRLGLGARISGPRLSVSAESALWFSNFVESRGADAITLRPEILYVLRPELANDRKLLEEARTIVEDCHKSAPDVLQWEERIVYLALTDHTALLEEEIWRGLRSVSQGTRQPLVNWISDMWLRLPPEATSNPVLGKLYQYNTGLLQRKSQSASGGEFSVTDVLLDFSSFPTRELGVVLRDDRFIIGDVSEAEFGIEVPDLNPVELDVALGSSRSWVEQIKVERGQVAEIVIRNGDTVRVRTLAGKIYELKAAFFRPPQTKRIGHRVFISYSHDSREHEERVLGLSERLRADGIEVLLDQYVNGIPPQGWFTWQEDQIKKADYVLVACSERLYRRYVSDPPQEYAQWPELVYVTVSEINRSRDLDKFIPVCLSRRDEEWIPEQLRSLTSYRLALPEAYEDLYRRLTQPRLLDPLAFDKESAGDATKYDVFRIVKYTTAELIGRENEMKVLDDAWEKVVRDDTRHPHILTFVGLGGEGKTSLIAKWTALLAHRDWPGCDAAFAWSFYSQGTSDRVQASSDSFLKAALTFFGDLDIANSATPSFDKGRRLAQVVGERRTLLILDGLEPLQYSPASPMPGELKDQGVSALLSIPDLQAFRNTSVIELNLGRINRADGVSLLKALGVKGTQAEFEKLVDDVKGHALTLNLVGNYLRDAHGGDIRKRDLLDLEEADSEEFGGSGFRMYAAYIRWLESEGERGKRAVALLRLLGLFDRPATIDSLKTLWEGEVITGLTETLAGLSESQRNMLLKRLEETKLLTVNRDSASGHITSIDSHPLLREYLAKQLRTDQPQAWRSAHRRLYEHLTKSTLEGTDPTLEDLQPLAQAVQSGCEAGMHQKAFDEVYVKRMQRGNEGYVWRKLGAFGFDLGVIAGFFEKHWLTLSPALSQMAQPFLLHNAALDLRALGRLTEALDPMRTAVGIRINQSDWKNAATSAGNLSELELTLGDTPGAVRDAEQAVSFADRSDDDFQLVARRENLADTYHQLGKLSEAEKLFFDAEHLQARRQPNYPLLYSVGGFRYCDLLLGQPERAVWRAKLHLKPQQSDFESLAAKCEAVIERTSQTLRWIAEYGRDLLSPALDRLSLARAAVYLTILGDRRPELKLRSEIDAAVDGLRRAGQQQYLPHALLTRALAQTLTGESGVQRDLDEAWEIAERGPMRLHMADIHLYRARLFYAVKPYPWDKNPDGSSRGPKDDLAAARKLIEQCGYWRRKEELEDAEEAAKSWISAAG